MPTENKNDSEILPPPVPETSPEEKKSYVKSLRTYHGDIEEALKKNKGSVSAVIIAEQKRKEVILDEPARYKRNETRNKFFIGIGFFLVLLGLGAVGGVYLFRSWNVAPPPPKVTTIVAHTDILPLEIASSTKEKVVSVIREKTIERLSENSLLYLPFTYAGNKATVSQVLELLTPTIPGPLLRSLDNEYMIGIYSLKIREPFLLLKTHQYADTYAGMLSWEKDMVSDFGGLFLIEMSTTSVVATSTPPVFRDEELKNKDLRVVKDGNGTTLFLYTFLDRNTLLITKNEEMMSAILAKYLLAKTVR